MILVTTCCSGTDSRPHAQGQQKRPNAFTAQDCLGRSTTTVLSGVYDRQYRVNAPTADTTFDARRATSTAFPFATLYPFSFGKSRPARHLCLLGGLVVGQQARDLTWDQVKAKYDGAGVRIAADGWYVVDGLRVENVEDGIDPRGPEGEYPKGGDGFVLRNLYFQYIRDDCVENDDIAGGVIEDSLFDGCNTGISERPTEGNSQFGHPAPACETLTLSRVLLRLQRMPGPRGHTAATLGHGELFKWSQRRQPIGPAGLDLPRRGQAQRGSVRLSRRHAGDQCDRRLARRRALPRHGAGRRHHHDGQVGLGSRSGAVARPARVHLLHLVHRPRGPPSRRESPPAEPPGLFRAH